MKRSAIVVSSLLLIAVMFSVPTPPGTAAEGELCVPVGTVTLSSPDSVTPRRSAVEFPHSRHFGYNCLECHHTWEKDDQIQGCTTSGCHDLAEAPGKGNRSLAIRYYKTAFHEMCIGCHKKIQSANLELEMSKKVLAGELPATGPTGCVGCHPR